MHRFILVTAFIIGFIFHAFAQEQNRVQIGMAAFDYPGTNYANAEKVKNIVLDIFSKNARFEVIDIGSREKVDGEKEAQKGIGFIDGSMAGQHQNQGAKILVTGTVNTLGADYKTNSDGSGGSYSAYFNITIKMLDVVRNTVVASEVITQSGRTNAQTSTSASELLRGLVDFTGGSTSGATEIEAIDNALSGRLPKYVNEFIRTYFPVELPVFEVNNQGKKYFLMVAGGKELGIQDKTRMEVFYKVPREVNGEVKYLEKVVGEVKMEKISGDFIEFKVLKNVGGQVLSLFNQEDIELLVREKP